MNSSLPPIIPQPALPPLLPPPKADPRKNRMVIFVAVGSFLLLVIMVLGLVIGGRLWFMFSGKDLTKDEAQVAVAEAYEQIKELAAQKGFPLQDNDNATLPDLATRDLIKSHRATMRSIGKADNSSVEVLGIQEMPQQNSAVARIKFQFRSKHPDLVTSA